MGQAFSAMPAESSDERIQAELRKEVYSVAPAPAIKEAARDPSCYWVDVRSVEEVIDRKLGYVATDKRWLFAPCNDDSCPVLEVAAENMIPDKDAQIILYCSSGRRAKIAQKTLESKGYKNVLNAGGLVDIFYPS